MIGILNVINNQLRGGGALPAPVPNFVVSSVSPTGVVQFTDTSTGTKTAWNWYFTGGTPATSTQQNPTSQWNTSGTYNVTLEVFNGSSMATITKPITISLENTFVPFIWGTRYTSRSVDTFEPFIIN